MKMKNLKTVGKQIKEIDTSAVENIVEKVIEKTKENKKPLSMIAVILVAVLVVYLLYKHFHEKEADHD